LEDTQSTVKEEKLFVSIFDGAVYGTKSEGSKETKWLVFLFSSFLSGLEINENPF
jgi:hypothetical protein